MGKFFKVTKVRNTAYFVHGFNEPAKNDVKSLLEAVERIAAIPEVAGGIKKWRILSHVLTSKEVDADSPALR
jgi:hypothetical protein